MALAHLRKYSVDLGLAFVVIIWGISPSLFKVALEEIEPFAFTYLRFLLITTISLLVLWFHSRRGGRAWRLERRDVLPLIVSGLSGYGIYQVFYILGLDLTTVFGSALLMATVPLFSAILLAMFRTERVGLVQWLGVLLAFGGVTIFLLAATGHTSQGAADRNLTPQTILLGDLLTLVAAVSFALYGITNKKLGKRFSQAELMCYTLIVGTAALTPIGLPALLHQQWSHVSVRSWLVIGYSIIFPIYVSYVIWNWAIVQRGVGYVTLYNYLVPILGGVGAFLLLGEGFSAGQLVGAGVVLAGLLLARWGMNVGRKEQKAAAEAKGTADVSAPQAGSMARGD
jgi:drug/metabolite transporter (DMT)-like permease